MERELLTEMAPYFEGRLSEGLKEKKAEYAEIRRQLRMQYPNSAIELLAGDSHKHVSFTLRYREAANQERNTAY
jgi:hypothetical protein